MSWDPCEDALVLEAATAPSSSSPDALPVPPCTIYVPCTGCSTDGPEWDDIMKPPELGKPDDFVPVTDPDFHLWNIVAQSTTNATFNNLLQPLLQYDSIAFGRVTDLEYATQMQLKYNEFVRNNMPDPTNPKRRMRGPVWPLRNIIKFKRLLALEQKSIVVNVLRTYQCVIDVLGNQLIELVNPETNQRKVDLKALDMYNKTVDKMRAWLPLMLQYNDKKVVSGP